MSACECLVEPQGGHANTQSAGRIDRLSFHSGPDSFTRSITDLESAVIAEDRDIGALNSHFIMTAQLTGK